MVYEFLRIFVEIALKFYFRTIYFLNEENIPDNEPIIVTANHSNSALDAIIIDAFLRKNKLYWLARGDVFANKWIAKFMTSVRTAPIYRSSEVGYVDIKRNNESFKICYELLNKNHMVGIFPEGITVPERKLQTPFKKGFGRLAFQAQEAIGKPVMILPIGVSYQSLTQTGTDVFVKFGQPFSSDTFYKEYQINHANGLKSITQHLESELNKLIINYDNVKNQELLVDEISKSNLKLVGEKPREFGRITDDRFFKNDLAIVNNLIESERSNTNFSIEQPKSNWPKLSFFHLVIYSIFENLAKLLYFIPNSISKYIIAKKIKNPAFWGTVRFVLLYLIFPIYTLLMAALINMFIPNSFLITLLVIPIIVGIGLRCKSLKSNI
jgi:1-acyl-sn-glycerol-3-phosphate acyltransferase